MKRSPLIYRDEIDIDPNVLFHTKQRKSDASWEAFCVSSICQTLTGMLAQRRQSRLKARTLFDSVVAGMIYRCFLTQPMEEIYITCSGIRLLMQRLLASFQKDTLEVKEIRQT